MFEDVPPLGLDIVMTIYTFLLHRIQDCARLAPPVWHAPKSFSFSFTIVASSVLDDPSLRQLYHLYDTPQRHLHRIYLSRILLLLLSNQCICHALKVGRISPHHVEKSRKDTFPPGLERNIRWALVIYLLPVSLWSSPL